MKSILQRNLRQLSAFSKRAARRLDSADKRAFLQRLAEWKRQDKERQFRTRYPALDQNSVVVDLGGYEGQWASDIYAEYLCNIYVFEPLPDYAANIQQRFRNNENIRVFDYGLGARNETLEFRVAGDSTSAFGEGGNKVAVKINPFEDFLRDHKIGHIHLLKINIEGGEYELLEHLLALDMVKNIDNLQIQFHNFVPNAEIRMAAIQEQLSETHATTYSFPFFWENWQRK